MTAIRLQDELAPHLVPVLLTNLTMRYPYHDSHVHRLGEPPHDPVARHPAFGNSFDWHSSVHSHWTGLRLVEYFKGKPCESQTPGVTRLHAVIANDLEPKNLSVESAYLETHPSYERPYGWAWAMMLAATACGAGDEAVHPSARALMTMAGQIAGSAVAWLESMPQPVRHGVHSNTAFALGLMLDAERSLHLPDLKRSIEGRALAWFAHDREWPQRWERSGHDFLSPGLAEADLMRRVLPAAEFAAWWKAFLPALDQTSDVLALVNVPDVPDGQIVHLHGLNLSRAAALARIARALAGDELLDAARRLYRASVDRAYGQDYNATHWLPTFAWDAAVCIDDATNYGVV